MGTEDWVLKGKKLITNTKKQRLKIQSRGWIFKQTILKKWKRNSQKLLNIYMKFALKNQISFFFCKVIVGYKNEDYRSNRGLKIFF